VAVPQTLSGWRGFDPAGTPSCRVEILVAEYWAGADMKELAFRWELHRTTVAGHLRQAGIALRRQGIPDELRDEAIQLYGEGWSCQRLADRYDGDDETVRQALRRVGVQLRKPWERMQLGSESWRPPPAPLSTNSSPVPNSGLRSHAENQR
jgi:hypothetical protein